MKETTKNNKPFYFFLISCSFDCIGERCTSIVMPILLYTITNDIYATSVLMIARFLPKFMSNYLVKRFSDKKVNAWKLLKKMAILRMAVIVLFFFAKVSWQFYVLTFTLSLSSSLCYVYRYSFMKNICSLEELPAANNINSLLENIIMFFSMLGGGIMYAALGLFPVILISTGSFFLSLVTLQAIGDQNCASEQVDETNQSNREKIPFFTTLYRLYKEYPVVLLLIVIDAIASISFGSLNTVLPIIVQEQFHNNSALYSSMMVALSLGLIIGNIVFQKWFSGKDFLWVYILSTFFATIFFTVLGCFYYALWFVALLTLIGLCNSVQDSSLVAKIQMEIEHREDIPFIFSVYQSLTAFMILFSTFIVPYVIDYLGTLALFIILGFINFFGLLLFIVKRRRLK